MQITKQNVILTLMAVLGLPGLPFACIVWLMIRFMIGDKSPMTKERFIPLMFAIAVVCGGVAVYAYGAK
jgi:hypothetical protein